MGADREVGSECDARPRNARDSGAKSADWYLGKVIVGPNVRSEYHTPRSSLSGLINKAKKGSLRGSVHRIEKRLFLRCLKEGEKALAHVGPVVGPGWPSKWHALAQSGPRRFDDNRRLIFRVPLDPVRLPSLECQQTHHWRAQRH